jgi:hypothetical protein
MDLSGTVLVRFSDGYCIPLPEGFFLIEIGDFIAVDSSPFFWISKVADGLEGDDALSQKFDNAALRFDLSTPLLPFAFDNGVLLSPVSSA